MADPATPSRPAKRQHTETIDLTSNSGNLVAAPESGKTGTVPARTQTLPANFNGDLNTLPDFDLNAQALSSSQIARLPATFTNSLLSYAAARDPYINSILAHQHELSILAHQHDLQRARERARVIDFTYYSQSAWEMLTPKYAARLGSSEAYERNLRNLGKMFDTIPKTVKDAGGYDCSYGTKKNAVETMTEIMMCMVTAPNDEIGRRAWNYVHVARDMERKLLGMMNYFAGDELAQLDKEGWTDKVRELQLADSHYLFYRLNKVVDMLEGYYEEESKGDAKIGTVAHTYRPPSFL